MVFHGTEASEAHDATREMRAGQVPGNAERLAQLSRAIGKMISSPSSFHNHLRAFGHGCSTQQHCLSIAFVTRYQVHTPVDAIGPIDVDRASRSKHRFVSDRSGSVGVACRIAGTSIRFDLVQPNGHFTPVDVRRDDCTEKRHGSVG